MEKIIIDSKTEILFDKDDWKLIEDGITQDTNRSSLYKYFSLNEYSLDSLKNDYVYLSNPKDFNDPFDCNRNLIIEKQKEIEKWQYVETLNDISNIGISCFSENGMEPLLWSHYADSYSGFCVKFKCDFLNQKNKELIKLKKVIYSQSPNSISIDSNFAKYYQYYLKLDNWSYENEWRLLFHNPSTVQNKCNFNVNSIEEISIGYKFMNPRNDNERKLKEQFNILRKEKFKDIPLYTVGPHYTKLELQKSRLVEGTVKDAMEMINHNSNRLFK
jgi:hypothetical protein